MVGSPRWPRLWPFLFYFSFYAALSTLYPYLALYYQGLGLTGAQIGLLTGLAPLITMLGAPLWTGIADASHRQRLVLSISILGAIACALAIPSIRDFALLGGIVSIYTLVTSPVISLADSATMSMLGDQRGSYGWVERSAGASPPMSPGGSWTSIPSSGLFGSTRPGCW